jgi:hypothetical protein
MKDRKTVPLTVEQALRACERFTNLQTRKDESNLRKTNR